MSRCGPGTMRFSFDATNPEAVRWARTRSAQLVVEIQRQARLAIRAIVERAFLEGVPPREAARLIRAVVGLTERDAQAVMRRQLDMMRRGVPPARAQALAERYAGTLHRARALTIARTECLPPDARVDAAVIGAVLRRWYDGPLVDVVTARGRQFSATPKHPVLSTRGWVAAARIDPGDDLVCDARDQDALGSVDPHIQARPSTIAEVFRAAQDVGVLERRVGRPDDFHGDGRETKVDVLRPDRLLRLGAFAPIYQPVAQDVLKLSDAAGAPLCLSCGRLLSVDQQPCLCDGTKAVSALSYDPTDHAVADSVRGPEWLRAFAGEVARTHVAGRKVLTGVGRSPSCAGQHQPPGLGEGARGFATLSELIGDPSDIGAHEAADCRQAEPGAIELDRVVNVTRRSWSGHVYNLSTPYGYFTANRGVYTGNTMAASNEGQQQLWRQAQRAGHLRPGTMKTWIVTDDERLCEPCNALGEEVVPVDDVFSTGGNPPAHPLCRCTVGIVELERRR